MSLPVILQNQTTADADEVMDNFYYLELLALASPRGTMINGKFSVTDTGSGILITITALDGTTPTATNPVIIRIGDTNRYITGAYSRTIADGTNWCNAGSAELATKEIDYFLYAVWDSNSSQVSFSPSRFPGGNLVSDFSATTTDEKHIIGYSEYTTTDEVEVVGRYAATLSAGAGYTWSVPTYTAINLIQKPIYQTRPYNWTATITVQGGGTVPTYTTAHHRAIINRNKISGSILFNNTAGGTAGAGAGIITFKLPFSVNASVVQSLNSRGILGTGFSYENGGTNSIVVMNVYNADLTQFYMVSSAIVSIAGNDQSSADRSIVLNFEYEI